ncbi:MAG: hypothetical protein JWO78_765 [Micavibrio sp.]|nr:hypothetical protein [Micavibrio sp.]
MMLTLFKLALSAGVISFASWLSGEKPELAGFVMALPLATLLVLPFSYMEYHDAAASVKFAQSIFIAVPLSLVFFVPFLMATKLGWSFPLLYSTGLALLIGVYFFYQWICRVL